MKRAWINLILLITMLSGICFPITVHAADAQWRMMHGEQDALVIGTIQEVTDEGYKVEVVQALWCKQDTSKGRMIPIEDVPAQIVIQEIRYDHSYHTKETPEVGDHIFISVDKDGNIWKQRWLGMEVSSTDTSAMEFAAPENMTSEAYAWQLFVSSGGEITNFAFEGEEKLYVDGEIAFQADVYQKKLSALEKEKETAAAVSAEENRGESEEMTKETSETKASEEGSVIVENDAVSISIIGGADGPTSIFLAGKIGRGVKAAGMIAGVAVIILVVAVITVVIRKNSKKK